MVVPLTPPRIAALQEALAAVAADVDRVARRSRDPVSFVHAEERDDDREIVALLAAQLAFGNVTTILAKVDDVLNRLKRHGKTPTVALDVLVDPAGDGSRLAALLVDFKHRVFIGADVAALLAGGRLLQRNYGSLGAAFAHAWQATGETSAALALARFCDELRALGKFPPRGDPTRRGASHLLPDVARGAGAKRLFLFLRWMVRPSDGVDLGIWDFSPAHLLIPVDTHIHKVARNLGFTDRNDASLTTAIEITNALRALDPEDPVRFDFSLCHLMMKGDCKEEAIPEICEGCPLRPVCCHHEAPASKTEKATRRRPRT
jgi:uncharacterized protein (TIGR02757 family)